MLHVRVPVRHSRARAKRRGPLHRGQPRASDQQGRDLREGQLRDHEAVFAGAAHETSSAPARRGARRRRIRPDRLGRSVQAPRRASREDPRDRSEAIRDVHRPRPDAGAHRSFRAPVRHAELCGARRLLLGQHGRRDDLHDRRLVLGIRRPRSRAREALRDDRHRRGPSLESAEDRDLEVQARRRALRLDQSGPHRLLRDRRRMDCDPAGHRRRPVPGAHTRADRAGTLRPRIPRALHERRAARQPRSRCGRFRPARARRAPAARSRPGAGTGSHADVVGPPLEPPGALAHRRRRPLSLRRVRAARRTRCEAGISAAEGARRRLHARMGRRDHGHTGQHDSPPRARARRHRARRAHRVADRLDRLVGPRARDGHRQSRRVPRDARTRCALERLPDDSRARDPDEPARDDRPARGIPSQGAVPANGSSLGEAAQRPRGGEAQHAARSARARLARRAGRPLRRRRRTADAHRQGVLVGVPARGPRIDAQRHHQRLARRPVPDRHAADLHGEHGVELDDEHAGDPAAAERQARRRRRSAASTRSRSSSSATRSSRR